MIIKHIINNLLKPAALGFVVIITIVSCEYDISYYKWKETYYTGTGHSNKIIIDIKTVRPDNGSIYVEMVLIDNFTNDAFNITEQYSDSTIHSRVHYWLSFNYLTISTHCRGVNKDMVAFPNSKSSPKWWPNDLKNTIFKRNRSKYDFYRCSAVFMPRALYFFNYLAIDNITKTAYYWNTAFEATDVSYLGKYYYEWEKF